MKIFILIYNILIGYAVCSAYPNSHTAFKIAGFAQGTTYEIKYYADHEIISKREVDSIFKEIDRSMSLYQSNSLISQFNLPTTKRLKLDHHMYNVVKASIEYNKLTKGYFDITIFPLLKLWGFGPNGFKFNPNNDQVDSVRQFIGIDKLSLKGNNLIKKNSNTSIDLNGIAQGYTVDVISKYLSDKHISSFIVEVGGEIFCKGEKPSGEVYKIEIQRPYYDKKESYKVALKDKAVTTSGNYEKYRIVEGEVFSHHINPFTGKPIKNTTISVTVIANSAMEADALDNYLMYLPAKDAIAFIESIPNTEAYVIYYENNTLKELQSSGFNNYIYKNIINL